MKEPPRLPHLHSTIATLALAIIVNVHWCYHCHWMGWICHWLIYWLGIVYHWLHTITIFHSIIMRNILTHSPPLLLHLHSSHRTLINYNTTNRYWPQDGSSSCSSYRLSTCFQTKRLIEVACRPVMQWNDLAMGGSVLTCSYLITLLAIDEVLACTVLVSLSGDWA